MRQHSIFVSIAPKVKFVKTLIRTVINFLWLHTMSKYAFWRTLYLLDLLNDEIRSLDWKTVSELNSKYRYEIEISNQHYARNDIESYMSVRRGLISKDLSFNRFVDRVPSNTYLLGNEFTSQFGHVTQIVDYFRGKKLGMFDVTPLIVASNFSNPWLYAEYIAKLMPLLPVSNTTNELLQMQFIDRYLHPSLMPSGTDWNHFFKVHNEIESRWSEAKLGPVFELSQNDLDFGYQVLAKTYGVREDSRLVTIHFRNDSRYHSARNVNAASYTLSIEWLLENDYWVLLLGDSNVPDLPIRHPHYLNYCNSDIKSDRLDLFVLAINRFMIGCSSGPSEIPNLFGKLLLWTNITQLGRHDYKSNAIMLPKLFHSSQSSTFESNFELGVLNTESQTSVQGVWKDNSEGEILTAIQKICALTERGSTDFMHGPLFSKLESLAKKKFTIIPEFFLENHHKYFFQN
jgi:putative glycosyltransferase (TIGR04372 family)